MLMARSWLFRHWLRDHPLVDGGLALGGGVLFVLLGLNDLWTSTNIDDRRAGAFKLGAGMLLLLWAAYRVSVGIASAQNWPQA